MNVVREISKLVMFVILWGIPVGCAVLFGSAWYLVLFIVSAIGTLMLFGHYEDLERAGMIATFASPDVNKVVKAAHE